MLKGEHSRDSFLREHLMENFKARENSQRRIVQAKVQTDMGEFQNVLPVEGR